MKPCSACGRDGDLLQVNSAITLQSFDVCVTCFENQAEPVSVVIRAVNDVGWKEIPEQIREAIRVFDVPDGELDGEYVRVGVWAERMSRRKLVPCPPDPVEEQEGREVDVLLRKMREVLETVSTPDPRLRRRRHWLMAFLGLFREMPA